jgi:GNAT superfamily N-acetyltransferase
MTLSRSQSISSASVRELTTVAEIHAAQRLRYTVWQFEGAVIHSLEPGMIADYHDEHATHWGSFDGDVLVGASRLCLHGKLHEAPDGEMFSGTDIQLPVASMNRLVVLRSYRGRGIGVQLDRVRIRKAQELGARTVIIAPINMDSRKQSLRQLGFHVLSDVTGHAKWSPTVEICACYLILRQPEEVANV